MRPSVYTVTVSAAPAFMPCPASAGAAETANGAVERMVLLGLTGAYYTKFRGNEITVRTKSICRANCRGAPATLTHAQRQAYTVEHIQKGPTLLTLIVGPAKS